VSQNVSAGLVTLRAPLRVGRPSFRLVRGTTTVISLSSSFTVVGAVTYQDFLYRGGSSARVALATAKGTCQSFCEANAVGCNWCAAEPMWLKDPRN